MPRLELKQLLRPTTDPETLNFLDQFYQKFDSGIAANKRIINVEPMLYQGPIAGTEFLVYDATKMYLCYRAGFDVNSASTNPFSGYIIFNNENNVSIMFWTNSSVFYNAAAATERAFTLPFMIKNIYFSVINISIYTQMSFNGYRITLI